MWANHKLLASKKGGKSSSLPCLRIPFLLKHLGWLLRRAGGLLILAPFKRASPVPEKNIKHKHIARRNSPFALWLFWVLSFPWPANCSLGPRAWATHLQRVPHSSSKKPSAKMMMADIWLGIPWHSTRKPLKHGNPFGGLCLRWKLACFSLRGRLHEC